MAFQDYSDFWTLLSHSLPCSQEKVRAVFDNLIQLEHLNIVKFHKYWADIKENKARVRSFSWAYPKQTSYIYCSFYIQRWK